MEVPYEGIGMNKWDIDTPALLVDVPTMERNIAVMADLPNAIRLISDLISRLINQLFWLKNNSKQEHPAYPVPS